MTNRYKSRKFLSSMAVFAVGLFTAATDSSVSGVEIADAVGTWIALSAPLAFLVVEGYVDRMAVAMQAQQQVVKYQTEAYEMKKLYAELQANLPDKTPTPVTLSKTGQYL